MKKYLYVNPAVIVTMVVYLSFCSALVTIMVYFIDDIVPWVKILTLVIWYSVLISYFYFTAINKVVVVSAKGVEFWSLNKKKLALEWKEIVEVGIVHYSPFLSGQTAKFICFASVANHTQIRITKFSDDCIYMKNRHGLVSFLRTYWIKEISGIENS